MNDTSNMTIEQLRTELAHAQNDNIRLAARAAGNKISRKVGRYNLYTKVTEKGCIMIGGTRRMGLSFYAEELEAIFADQENIKADMAKFGPALSRKVIAE